MRSSLLSTISGSGEPTQTCSEKVVRGLQYILATSFLLGYVVILPIIPYWTVFSDGSAYLRTGYINDDHFHCTYHCIQIDLSDTNNVNSELELSINIGHSISNNNDEDMISSARSDAMYWNVFVLLCFISSLFGYWVVLLCPAFKMCLKAFWTNNGKYVYVLSKCDCCSWRSWIINSIVSTIFVMFALILALRRPCTTDVIQLYKTQYSDEEVIEIRDMQIGLCIWYLLILIVFNMMIGCLCLSLKNEEHDALTGMDYKPEFGAMLSVKKRGKVYTMKSDETTVMEYHCVYCKDVGYVANCGCFNKKHCPICTSWEELDDF